MRIADYINALPDSFRKDADSNNYKLLSLEQSSIQGLRDDIKALDDVLDIFKATGKTLDLYGNIYGQHRGNAADEQYRYLILQKAVRNLSGCDHASVMNALTAIFNTPVSSISITDSIINCAVEVKAFPYEAVMSSGFTMEQITRLIETMLAVGVRLSGINFEGTFEFGELENDYDESKGFADEAQTIGGFFGFGYINFLYFEFAELDNERDVNQGFADDGQAIGGYFDVDYADDLSFV